MVSKWVLGAVAVAGLGVGVVAADSPPKAMPNGAAGAEEGQLYRTEVALNAQETHLQALLSSARAQQSKVPATPAPATPTLPQAQLIVAAPPPTRSAPGPAATPSASPSASASLPVYTAGPTTTTTEPTQEATTTTEPLPAPTTTSTTRPPTTTTTRPSGEGDGGTDD